jgi:integrase
MTLRQPYPTDPSDADWQMLASLVPAAKPGGRPEEYPKREIINVILFKHALNRLRSRSNSLTEVAALLHAPQNLKQHIILTTLYATGGRVSELCQLRRPDVDSARIVHIRQGKG